MACNFTSAWSQVWIQLPQRSWQSNCEHFRSPPSMYTFNSGSYLAVPKDTIKAQFEEWERDGKPPPSQVDGIHFGPGDRPDSWDKEHSGLWHAAMAPSVAALKIHAVWCRHTSQLSGRRRGRRERERKRGDRHIDRYDLKHLRSSRKRDWNKEEKDREDEWK